MITNTRELEKKQKTALLREARSFRIRYRIGQFIDGCVKVFQRQQKWEGESFYDRLPPEKLDWLLKVQADQVDHSAAYRAQNWQVQGEDKHNMYAVFAKAAETVIANDPGLIAHIGARVDVVSAYLAPRHSESEFVSVDLQANLAEHNAMLPQHQNWRFVSGYALDILPDIAPTTLLAMFTTCKMTKGEFNNLLEIAAKSGVRNIVIMSTFKPNHRSLWKLSITPPEAITDTYITSAALLDPTSEQPVFVHNNAAHLEAHGYTVEHTELVNIHNGLRDGFGHLIIAKR